MEDQEVWAWGYSEGIEAATQWLNRYGLNTNMQARFRSDMSETQAKISKMTFDQLNDKVNWT